MVLKYTPQELKGTEKKATVTQGHRFISQMNIGAVEVTDRQKEGVWFSSLAPRCGHAVRPEDGSDLRDPRDRKGCQDVNQDTILRSRQTR